MKHWYFIHLTLFFDHHIIKMPSGLNFLAKVSVNILIKRCLQSSISVALVVNQPPYKEWAGFKWPPLECSQHSALCFSYKTSQCRAHYVRFSGSLTRLWNFRNSINDGWRRRYKQWPWCWVRGKHAASQKSERPTLLHGLLAPFILPLWILSPQAVCSGGQRKIWG